MELLKSNRTLKHKTLLALALSCLFVAFPLRAQTPKWADKARKSVVKITTYGTDKQQVGEGTAFFVDETGVALSSYSLFKSADSATATDFEGKVMPVELIMGVNDLYDVVKIRIAPAKKKVPALRLAETKPVVGESVVMIPYSSRKKAESVTGAVESTSPMEGDTYYTLSLIAAPDQYGSPVFNEEGEVFGLLQPPAEESDARNYALPVTFGISLSVSAFSFNDPLLNAIGIPKDLPATREEALTMLYLTQSNPADRTKVADLIDRFIERYPDDSEGYKMRSNFYSSLFSDNESLLLVERDLKTVMELSKGREDEAYYHNSQCILNYAVRQDSAARPFKDWGYERSLAEIQKAIGLSPKPLYYQQEANIYSLMNEYAKAYEAFQKVNASNLASYSTFYASSRLLRAMGDTTSQALSLMDSCVARFQTPYTAEAAPYLFERAEMRVAAGQDSAALADYDAYERCVGKPQNALFYYKREQTAMRLKKYDRALQDIRAALRQMPRDPALLEEQGSVFVSMARYEEAVNSLEASLSYSPNRPYALRLKGFALLQLDKREEARQALENAKDLGDPVSVQILTRFFGKGE